MRMALSVVALLVSLPVLLMAEVSDTSSKMLSLKLLQVNGTIRVLEAEVVNGKPRGRFQEEGPRFEMLSSGGVSGVGVLPAPVPVSYDFLDSTGTMTGGTLPADSIEWFVRVPYKASDDQINFYEAAKSDAPLGRSAVSAPIGSCRLQEVLK